MKICIFLLFCLFLLFVLCFLAYLLGFSNMLEDRTKSSPFECGFSPFGESGFSFSMPFFIISLMFLLFDVEILLVCFYPLLPQVGSSVSFGVIFILFFVLFSTLYEWGSGVLSWV